MKPDYKNWMPKGMIIGMTVGTAVLFILLLLAMLIPGTKNGFRIFIIAILAIAFIAMLIFTIGLQGGF